MLARPICRLRIVSSFPSDLIYFALNHPFSYHQFILYLNSIHFCKHYDYLPMCSLFHFNRYRPPNRDKYSDNKSNKPYLKSLRETTAGIHLRLLVHSQRIRGESIRDAWEKPRSRTREHTRGFHFSEKNQSNDEMIRGKVK